MGVNLKSLIMSKEITIKDLQGRKIGIDAYNWSYQFLSTIRLRTGELLKDSSGRVTSHIIGTLTRTINLLSNGVKPCYVWDGTPPPFKIKTLEAREKRKKEAKKAFEKAETSEEKRKYAQQISRLNSDMIKDANELLDALGVPHIQAASEGEAQISHMVKKGDFFACASQDWDSLLFGSNILARNLSASRKRRIPNTNIFKTVNPELINLRENLNHLGLSQQQLIAMGLLIGTDYCPGVKGYGPKKSLALVKKEKTLNNIFKAVDWSCDTSPHTLVEWFLNPKVNSDYHLEWNAPNEEKLLKILVDKHNFEEARVKSQIKPLFERDGNQQGLNKYF